MIRVFYRSDDDLCIYYLIDGVTCHRIICLQNISRCHVKKQDINSFKGTLK